MQPRNESETLKQGAWWVTVSREDIGGLPAIMAEEASMSSRQGGG